MKSISPQSLSSALSDIGSVVSMVDRIAGSAPGNGSRASVGEDFVAKTKCRLQARNFMAQEGMTPTKKMKRGTTAMPLSVYSLEGSVGDNCKQFACSETSDLESTATSVGKKARTEVCCSVRLPLGSHTTKKVSVFVILRTQSWTADRACSFGGNQGNKPAAGRYGC